mgnify:CR=1 FL=1
MILVESRARVAVFRVTASSEQLVNQTYLQNINYFAFLPEHYFFSFIKYKVLKFGSAVRLITYDKISNPII